MRTIVHETEYRETIRSKSRSDRASTFLELSKKFTRIFVGHQKCFSEFSNFFSRDSLSLET